MFMNTFPFFPGQKDGPGTPPACQGQGEALGNIQSPSRRRMFTPPCLSVFLSGRIRLSITLTEFHKKAIHRFQMPSKTRDTGSLFRFSGHFGLSVHLYCNRIHVVNKYNQLYQIKCMYFMGCQRNRSFSGGCSSDSYLSRNFKNPQPASPDTPPGHLHH